jgi:hypothetical protein
LDSISAPHRRWTCAPSPTSTRCLDTRRFTFTLGTLWSPGPLSDRPSSPAPAQRPNTTPWWTPSCHVVHLAPIAPRRAPLSSVHTAMLVYCDNIFAVYMSANLASSPSANQTCGAWHSFCSWARLHGSFTRWQNHHDCKLAVVALTHSLHDCAIHLYKYTTDR